MQKTHGGISEWLLPLAFVATTAWLVWHLPAFLLDWLPYTSDSLRAQVEAIYLRADVTPEMGGIFGGHIDVLDIAALILTPIIAFFGARNVQPASMEYRQNREYCNKGNIPEAAIYSIVSLFDQLGLESTQNNVNGFIANSGPLSANTALHQENFWNTSQASFIKLKLHADADWIQIVNRLGVMLR